MICLIKYFYWKKRVVSLWLFRFIRAYNYSTRAVKWSLGIANAALLNLSSATVLFFPAIHRFLYFRFCICRLKSIKIDQNQSWSNKVDNHKKLCDRLLSISDICRLICIDNDRQQSNFIDYRNYRHVTSCTMAVTAFTPLLNFGKSLWRK